MQVVAGPRGCKEYRNGELVFLKEGEPVPEMLKLKYHDLRRRERRGEIRIDWDAEDPLLASARSRPPVRRAAEGAGPGSTTTVAPGDLGPAPSFSPSVASPQGGNFTGPPAATVQTVASAIAKTTRGYTQHLRLNADQGRFLCGAAVDAEALVGEVTPEVESTAKACMRCARRYSDLESEQSEG